MSGRLLGSERNPEKGKEYQRHISKCERQYCRAMSMACEEIS